MPLPSATMAWAVFTSSILLIIYSFRNDSVPGMGLLTTLILTAKPCHGVRIYCTGLYGVITSYGAQVIVPFNPG
jgi:hypothetical protein